jgi:hypothetical protein
MKQVVDRIYTVLLRLDDPGFVERMDQYAFRTTNEWDEPKNLNQMVRGQLREPCHRWTILRHQRYLGQMGLADRLAGERAPSEL